MLVSWFCLLCPSIHSEAVGLSFVLSCVSWRQRNDGFCIFLIESMYFDWVNLTVDNFLTERYGLSLSFCWSYSVYFLSPPQLNHSFHCHSWMHLFFSSVVSIYPAFCQLNLSIGIAHHISTTLSNQCPTVLGSHSLLWASCLFGVSNRHPLRLSGQMATPHHLWPWENYLIPLWLGSSLNRKR